MNKLDYKKKYKELYQPKEPVLIEVPPIAYAVIEGCGDPNETASFQEAISLLYGLSYMIKMDKDKPNRYFEYVIPPLEGLWWVDNSCFDGLNIQDKNQFQWLLMIRLPEFVDEIIFNQAKEKLRNKKQDDHVNKLEFRIIDEGLCVQTMHIGSFDLEAQTILNMKKYVQEMEYQEDINENRRHHEIYLSDFRRTKTANLRTVIRHPVKKTSD